ncbi:MAG TPA: zinc ribbon domain-containing protein [Armatimonadota bacterium]|nr:zinc ribbon domain-containing protein [Armatimonadota bacterium]
MPIYEYRCNGCGRKFSALVGVVADARPPACPRCGSVDLARLMSRFASPRSEDARLESLGDPSALENMDDPAAMRQWMRQMSREMGEDGDDLEELMEEAMEEETDEEEAGGEPAASPLI